MDRTEAYKAAVAMLQREHARWVQNALVLFGALVSVFLVYKDVRCVVPLWFPMMIAAAISLITVLVALSIRASTDAWTDTLQQIENSAGNSFKTWDAFDCHLRRQTPVCDLLAGVCERQFEPPLCYFARRVRATLLSVTRVYAWTAIVLTVTFGILSCVARHYEDRDWVRKIEHRSCAVVTPAQSPPAPGH